jgi:hypothetical protein
MAMMGGKKQKPERRDLRFETSDLKAEGRKEI